MQQDGNKTSSSNSAVIVNVMDFDMDEEQEREERELESYRQNANQRLAELKQKSLNSLGSVSTRLPNSAPGLESNRTGSSSSLSSNITNNNNNNIIQQSKRFQTPTTTTTNYTSKIINRTSGVVQPPSSSSVSPSSSSTTFTPQKFIPPPRTSQTSQNSQNSQRGSSPNVGLTSSFVTPVKSSILTTTSTPVFIPPFSSGSSSSTPSTPSSVGAFPSNSGSPQVVSTPVVLPDSYVPFPTTATTIVANEVQKKNPIVKHIRDKVFKVHFTKDWTLTDYILGRQTIAFYLSLKFHMTKPKYILERIKNYHKTDICKRNTFTNRIILVNVDVHVDSCGDSSIYLSNQDSQEREPGTFKAPTYVSETALDEALIEVTRISMWADWTVICGFSDEECALYLETIRACESKSASLIQGPNQTIASIQSSTNSLVTSTGGQGKRKGNRRWSRESSSSGNSKQPVEVEKLSHTEEVHQLFASSLKSTLNKRDHITLLNHFGSLKEVIQTTTDELNDLPGFGKKKVKKLINLFQTPFVPGKEGEVIEKKKPAKKQANIKLVKKSILPDVQDDDDDLFIVDQHTGKEEKINCKLKVTRKQSGIDTFFSQKPKTEEDSD